VLLDATAVQLGTAYLSCPEARISAVHREMLRCSRDDQTALTNVFTGRPARSIVNRLVREVGPMSLETPEFPLAAAAVMPLRQAAQEAGSGDFLKLPAGELTRHLAVAAREWLGEMGRRGLASPR
jgi:nitronate monooxygenase